MAVGGKIAAVVGSFKAGFAGALVGQAQRVSISIQLKINGNAGAGAGLAVLRGARNGVALDCIVLAHLFPVGLQALLGAHRGAPRKCISHQDRCVKASAHLYARHGVSARCCCSV